VLALQGERCTLVLDLRRGEAVLAYAGPRLPEDEDLAALCDAVRRAAHASQPDAPPSPTLLPQSGTGFGGLPAVLLQCDGRPLHAEFVLVEAEATDRKDGWRLRLVDERLTLSVTIEWSLDPHGVISCRTRLDNHGTTTIAVLRLASLALPLPAWAQSITRYAGRWAAEMQAVRSTIAQGLQGAMSFEGRPGHSAGHWLLIEEPITAETRGLALGAHLVWSGDHEVFIGRDADGARMLMSARLDAGEIRVGPGGMFEAPDAVLCVGDGGRAALRHALHRHVREQLLPKTPAGPRRVHLNTWEAVGFRQDLPTLQRLAQDAAALGIERFVLDDGWFRGRRDDTRGLGDWQADPALFPEGLGPLIDTVRDLGMDFGLWVEPEMLSPDSDLHRTHPDWCLHEPDRARGTQRHQLVLDLTLPAVIDHLFTLLAALLRDHDIAYLKWDHNRALFPRAGRAHAQTVALYALLDRLRAAHPEVEIEACASGGARVDYAMLRRCARFWASDGNDPVERLRINAGYLQFLPLCALGHHVGPDPNPITGRRLGMDFRAKVAMFGHMGVEADPAAMDDAERTLLTRHIALYKDWRTVLHEGDLFALDCPTPGVSGWLAVRSDRALALVAQTEYTADFEAASVRLPGLPQGTRWRVTLPDPWPAHAARHLADPSRWREGLILSAEALATQGLALPLTWPQTAWLVALERAA
jgi:alpha-galactosidase